MSYLEKYILTEMAVLAEEEAEEETENTAFELHKSAQKHTGGMDKWISTQAGDVGNAWNHYWRWTTEKTGIGAAGGVGAIATVVAGKKIKKHLQKSKSKAIKKQARQKVIDVFARKATKGLGARIVTAGTAVVSSWYGMAIILALAPVAHYTSENSANHLDDVDPIGSKEYFEATGIGAEYDSALKVMAKRAFEWAQDSEGSTRSRATRKIKSYESFRGHILGDAEFWRRVHAREGEMAVQQTGKGVGMFTTVKRFWEGLMKGLVFSDRQNFIKDAAMGKPYLDDLTYSVYTSVLKEASKIPYSAPNQVRLHALMNIIKEESQIMAEEKDNKVSDLGKWDGFSWSDDADIFMEDTTLLPKLAIVYDKWVFDVIRYRGKAAAAAAAKKAEAGTSANKKRDEDEAAGTEWAPDVEKEATLDLDVGEDVEDEDNSIPVERLERLERKPVNEERKKKNSLSIRYHKSKEYVDEIKVSADGELAGYIYRGDEASGWLWAWAREQTNPSKIADNIWTDKFISALGSLVSSAYPNVKKLEYSQHIDVRKQIVANVTTQTRKFYADDVAAAGREEGELDLDPGISVPEDKPWLAFPRKPWPGLEVPPPGEYPIISRLYRPKKWPAYGPKDDVLWAKENYYINDLWAPIRDELGYKAARTWTGLSAWNIKRERVMKLSSSDPSKLKRLHLLINARIEDMFYYYDKMVGDETPHEQGIQVADTGISSVIPWSAVGPTKKKTIKVKRMSKSQRQAKLSNDLSLDLAVMQSTLKARGYFAPDSNTFKSGKADGKYGRETEGAIKDLQRDLEFTGAAVDGLWGPKTMEAYKSKAAIVKGKHFKEPVVKKKTSTPVIASDSSPADPSNPFGVVGPGGERLTKYNIPESIENIVQQEITKLLEEKRIS
jgi:peptidoglycan hydrolase-like protein with peptidoglycan-binding domain